MLAGRREGRSLNERDLSLPKWDGAVAVSGEVKVSAVGYLFAPRWFLWIKARSRSANWWCRSPKVQGLLMSLYSVRAALPAWPGVRKRSHQGRTLLLRFADERRQESR
jgi:hypothetical protein